jgi:hypothetical protein
MTETELLSLAATIGKPILLKTSWCPEGRYGIVEEPGMIEFHGGRRGVQIRMDVSKDGVHGYFSVFPDSQPVTWRLASPEEIHGVKFSYDGNPAGQPGKPGR